MCDIYIYFKHNVVSSVSTWIWINSDGVGGTLFSPPLYSGLTYYPIYLIPEEFENLWSCLTAKHFNPA